MIKEAIEKVLQLAAPTVLKFGEVERGYTDRQIFPVLDPMPKILGLNTLTGIQDYLKDNPDGLDLDEVLIHVAGPTSVQVFSRLTGAFEQRKPYLDVLHAMPMFPFGKYMDIETFIIELQAKFVQCEQSAAILQLMGTVTEGLIRTYADDGISQEITAKNGIGRVEQRPVPNPVLLSPFRTFNEVAQPVGRFVFRLKPGQGEKPLAALFEADGGAWQLTAIKSIRDWLRANVPDEVVVIA